MSSDEDEAVSPAIFGSSVQKERIKFVPAEKENEVEPVSSSRSLGEKYLAIVLNGSGGSTGHVVGDQINRETCGSDTRQSGGSPICNICRLPVKRDEMSGGNLSKDAHDLSLAHQVCVHHSYPPSHLDRNRPGLKYLSSYGWDVDSRRGLGATGQGRLAPLKAAAKNNTVGLGMDIPQGAKTIVKPVLLDAGKIRKREVLEKRKRARLQELFYQDEDIEKYLGSGENIG